MSRYIKTKFFEHFYGKKPNNFKSDWVNEVNLNSNEKQFLRSINEKNIQDETREYKRILLKKAFGERNADLVLSKLPIVKYPIQTVIDYLKFKLPIKSTFPKIVQELAGYLTADYMKRNNQVSNIKKTEHKLDDLLKKSNYTMEVVDNVNDAIKKYSKYYNPNERICTLNSNSRFIESYVTFFKHFNIDNIFHAKDLTQDNLSDEWKKYLSDIGRMNSDKTFNLTNLIPNEHDPYSKSLLCIQISKKGRTLKTISRYNHTVKNPDFIYRNLDDIIDGLHHTFYNYFNVEIPTGSQDEIPYGYILDKDNRLFKYDDERSGNYYGDGFVVKSNGDTIIINRNEELMIDGAIFNIKDASVTYYGQSLCIGKIKKIISKSNNQYSINVEYDTDNIYNAIITVIDSKLVSFESHDIKIINDEFLYNNENLTSINLPNVTNIGGSFLYNNIELTSIDLPKVEIITENFLYKNEKLISINLPNVTNIGGSFLYNNIELTSIDLPKVEIITENFLYKNEKLISINLPIVEEIEKNFLYNNTALTSIDLSHTKKILNNFLYSNEILNSINLPNVNYISDSFLYKNEILNSINLPKVQKIGCNFLYYNDSLISISLPEVINIDDDFLSWNTKLKSINIPKIKRYGRNFLRNNDNIKNFKI